MVQLNAAQAVHGLPQNQLPIRIGQPDQIGCLLHRSIQQHPFLYLLNFSQVGIQIDAQLIQSGAIAFLGLRHNHMVGEKIKKKAENERYSQNHHIGQEPAAPHGIGFSFGTFRQSHYKSPQQNYKSPSSLLSRAAFGGSPDRTPLPRFFGHFFAPVTRMGNALFAKICKTGIREAKRHQIRNARRG